MIYLKNATYVDSVTLEFKKTNIQVEQGKKGKIQFIDKLPENINPNEIIDCNNKIVTKSFACGHHHVYSALSRGMGAPKKNPENFLDVLTYICSSF